MYIRWRQKASGLTSGCLLTAELVESYRVPVPVLGAEPEPGAVRAPEAARVRVRTLAYLGGIQAGYTDPDPDDGFYRGLSVAGELRLRFWMRALGSVAHWHTFEEHSPATPSSPPATLESLLARARQVTALLERRVAFPTGAERAKMARLEAEGAEGAPGYRESARSWRRDAEGELWPWGRLRRSERLATREVNGWRLLQRLAAADEQAQP